MAEMNEDDDDAPVFVYDPDELDVNELAYLNKQHEIFFDSDGRIIIDINSVVTTDWQCVHHSTSFPKTFPRD
jgi:hypothetical protein